MKTMTWYMESGRELRIESDGDEIKITIPGVSVSVLELQHCTPLSPTELGTFLKLGLQKVDNT